jgi:proteasome lid subunit RPN8/RPN11
VIALNKELYAAIQAEGIRAYPSECCGVMIGHDIVLKDGSIRREVQSLQPLTNSFEKEEQYHRFRLDPLEYINVEKAAGAAGKLVLGFYHSHPDCPAAPSEYDRQHGWPFYSYVIVSIMKSQAAEMTSWQLNEQTEQFVPEEITLIGPQLH